MNKLNLQVINTQQNVLSSGELTINQLIEIKPRQKNIYCATNQQLTAKFIQQNSFYENGQPLPYQIDIAHLKQYGIGLYLYFDFLKKIIYVMLIMSLIALIASYFNYQGNGLDKYGQTRSNFLLLSLANQPEYIFICSNTTNPNTQNCISSNNQTLSTFVNESNSRLLKVSIPDFIYSVFFLVFLLYWNYYSKNIINEHQAVIVTPSKFTVQVTIKNKDITIENQQIFNHFNRLGQVYAVQLAYDYNGVMYKIKQLGQIIKKTKYNKAMAGIYSENLKQRKKYQALYYQNISQIAKTIKEYKQEIDLNDLKCIKIYVMFNTTESAFKIYQMYKSYQLPLLQKIFCGCCLADKPKQLLFKGQTDLFKVKQCKIQPSDVLWENLDISKKGFICRAFLTFIFLIILFLLTFFIIVGISLFSPNTYKITSLGYSPSYQQALISNDFLVIDTYCLSQTISTIIYNSSVYQLCKSSIYRYYAQVSLNQLISLVIVLTNMILSKVINKLSQFRRFRSKSQLAYQISFTQMFAMILNTSLINVLLQANIFNFIPAEPESKLLKNSLLSSYITSYPIYTDFSREWYIDVGIKLTSMWLINILFPFLGLLLITPLLTRYRSWRASLSKLQIQANKYILGQQFELSYYFSFMLYTITVSLIFCGPLPYFLLFGCFALIFLYISSKYYLLRMCKKPPSYSSQLNQLISIVLPISLIVHLLISLYCYSYQNIFPNNYNSFSLTLATTLSSIGVTSSTLETSNENFDTIAARITRVIYLFILLILIAIGYMFKRIIINGLKKFWIKYFQTKIYNQKLNSFIFEEQIHQIKKKMIKDYNIQNNPEYEEVELILQITEALKKRSR